MTERKLYDIYFEPATAVSAEGSRIGLTNCKICGAAILLDPRSTLDFALKHIEWHMALDHFAGGTGWGRG